MVEEDSPFFVVIAKSPAAKSTEAWVLGEIEEIKRSNEYRHALTALSDDYLPQDGTLQVTVGFLQAFNYLRQQKTLPREISSEHVAAARIGLTRKQPEIIRQLPETHPDLMERLEQHALFTVRRETMENNLVAQGVALAIVVVEAARANNRRKAPRLLQLPTA